MFIVSPSLFVKYINFSIFLSVCQVYNYLLKLSEGNPTLVYTYKISPLSVIKQIIVMLLAVNDPGFTQANTSLAAFVLEKENNHLPPKYKIFTYYNIKGMHRNVGLSAKLSISTGKATFMSEVSFPPFGYLLTIDSEKPDERLLNISGFANYRYNDFVEIQMKMAVLPTHLLYPGDYRSKEEIHQTRNANETNHD